MHTSRIHPLLAAILILSLITLACSLSDILNPPLTPTSAPPAATETPLVFPSAAPTGGAPTLAPSPVPSMEPLRLLDDAGPWLVIATDGGFWAANGDGSGLTQITSETLGYSTSASAGASPSGGHLVYITSEDGLHHLTLNLFSFDTLATQVITPLSGPASEPQPDDQPGDAPVEAMRAIVEMESFAWSPDGSTLAFIGAMDGTSSDLYTYVPATRQITRLTNEAGHAFHPMWAPDGQHIVFFEAEVFGSGAGITMKAAWVARADGGGVTKLYDSSSSGEEFAGWLGDGSFVVYSFDPGCGASNLRRVTITPKAVTTLYSGCFTSAATYPYGDTILLTGGDASLDSRYPGDGVFQVNPDQTLTPVISDPAAAIGFLPGGVFKVHLNDGSVSTLDNMTGEWSRGDAPEALGFNANVDFYGLIWLWTGENGAWISGPGLETIRLTDLPADLPTWSDDNNAFHFVGENLFVCTFDGFYSDNHAVGRVPGSILGMGWVY